MEFYAITPKGTRHVCSVHRAAGDSSPLEMISAQELARFQRIEAAHAALLASLTAARRRLVKSTRKPGACDQQ